ncbi:copper chaperone PCu(A)C [Azotobacter armeniacus]
MFARIALFSLLALSCTTVLATDYQVGELQIGIPWSLALPPNAPAGAAYLTVKNNGRTADRLICAKTPNAAKVELHTHIRRGDVMHMQRVDSLTIPAGTEVKFAPGMAHLMLLELKSPLAAGERFPVTLEFEKAGKVEIEVNVWSDAPANEGHEHH